MLTKLSTYNQLQTAFDLHEFRLTLTISMKYVATFLQPSSVVDSLCIRLTEDSENEYLVVAKSSYLEIYAVLADAIKLQCKHDVWGRILSVSLLPVDDTEV